MTSGPHFFETIMGRKFYEVHMPQLVQAVNRLAIAQEESNQLAREQQNLLTERLDELMSSVHSNNETMVQLVDEKVRTNTMETRKSLIKVITGEKTVKEFKEETLDI